MTKEKNYNLNYKIMGKRELEHDIDAWDVVWSHNSEGFTDYEHLPITGPPYRPGATVECPDSDHQTYEQGGQHFAITPKKDVRTEIKDQINVPSGTKASVVMQICEEKRKRLAENLGVSE